MGTVIHRATIVTSWNFPLLKSAYRKAKTIFPKDTLTSVKISPVNKYRSFAILTCGSKQRWPHCDADRMAREEFRQWVADQAYEDGSNALEFVDVAYGNDAGTPSATTAILSRGN